MLSGARKAHCMAESTQGQVVLARAGWALLVPIFYGARPLMRIALKGNPRLPQYYAARSLGTALRRGVHDVQRLDGTAWASPRSGAVAR